MDYNFLSALLDEVALEGLDGITLPMFWLRLQNRPNFPIALDENSKIFLWECIAVHRDVEIYELSSPRILVPIYNRYDYIDKELGIVLEPAQEMTDPYPIECINDGDIRGSCSTYSTRTCITSEIRYDDVLLMPLNQVNEKWGEKLVLVASPKSRLIALIGTEINPLIDITLEQYCLLERIGRSRYLGEVTQGEGGLLNLKAPFCKQLHYHRKKLTLKGLVIKQLHYMKNKKGQATTGSLFHLTRFFTPHKTRMEYLMKCMCDILKDKPHNREQSKALRQALDIKENTFKKLFYRPFQKYVKMVTIPYKEFCPNATPKERLTSNGQDRVVKVVQLMKHFDEVDDTEFDENNEKEKYVPLNIHFDFSKIYHDEPMISQTYRIIKKAGPDGLTSATIGRITTLPRLDVRTLLKELVKKDLVVTVLQERGRQKEQRYIDKSYIFQNEEYFINKKKKDELTPEKLNNSENDNISSKRKNTDSFSDDCQPPNKKIRLDEKAEEAIPVVETKELCSKEVSSKQLSIQNIVSEVSEIQESNIFTGKAPKLISLTEKIVNPTIHKSACQLTDRKLKRMKMVLDFLKSVGLSTLTDVQKFLIDKEKEEGYNFKIDKKSSARMVHKLFLAKKLRIYKATLKLDDKKAELEFVCDNSVELTDSRVQLAVQQAKFRIFSLNTEKNRKIPTNIPKKVICGEKNVTTVEGSSKENTESKGKHLNSLFLEKRLVEYQIHPKCSRYKTLHKFLFYLVHNYGGHSGDQTKLPVVYHDSMTWKRFVPPLNSVNQEGWCYLGDIYTHMPLSIFVKVFNLRARIIDFVEYLNDEEKCHYLITDLPQDVIGDLLIQRKYLFAVDDVLKYLSYMGLISFGPQTGKLKQEVYLYIHKKAALRDTTISTPGYIHVNSELTYEKKIYTLNSLDDVDSFWMDLESICFHTPLGKYSAVAGKTFAVVEASHKSELLEASRNKNFDEISDIGFIPGDGLGAAGFDSSLFFHSRRNWQPPNSIKSIEQNSKTDSKNPTISIQNLLKNKESLGPENRSRLQRLNRYRFTSQKNKTIKENKLKENKSKLSAQKSKLESSKSLPATVLPKKRRRVKIRTVKVRHKKMRQLYVDEKDRDAIRKMSRARCEWSAQEDSFLLLCKVASSFLDPISRTLVVPYTVVRDLLHEKFPDLSANKSSRACQRRVRYMMMNSTTANNVAVFLGEAKQDKNLVKEFDRVKPVKTNEAVWKEMFTGVLKRLLEKFTLPAADRCKNVTLPSDIETFNKAFEMMSPRNMFNRKNNHKNPDFEEEVIHSTLYSLIVSAMAIGHDETEWSYLLYKLYQVYPEYVLRCVVARLRSEKIIAVKKKAYKKDLQRSLMSSFPYRFSITYENALMTKFPIKLFNEAKELIDILKNRHFSDGLELKGDMAPGYAAAVLALESLNIVQLDVEIPEQIIIFDSSLSREARTSIVERMINTLTDKESIELSRLLNNNEKYLSQGCKRKDDDSQILNEHFEEEQTNDISKKKPENDVFQTNEVQRSTNASRFALYLLRQELSQPPIERVQHSQDYIVLNSCKVFCHLKPLISTAASSDDGKHSQMLPTQNPNNLREKILTDGCISEIKTSLTATIPEEALSGKQNFDESLEIMYDSYSPQTLNDAKSIFEEILKAGSVGVTETHMWRKFRTLNGELSCFEHLHLFRESLLVIRVGVASFVYVCIYFAKNWILASYELPEICRKKKAKISEDKDLIDNFSNESKTSDIINKRDSIGNDNQDEILGNEDDYNSSFHDSTINFTKRVYFLPRTWRYPDGTLNKQTFIELLQTVLSYIISSPGVNVSRVTDHFSLTFQPVTTLELLEILEKACCINKYYVKKFSKRTLFSKPGNIFITKNPGPDDFDHLEPLPDAVCNLARLQEAILQV